MQHRTSIVIPSILTWVVEKIHLTSDMVNFALTCRIFHEVVHRDKGFRMMHVVSEIRPYALRTSLRGEAVVRFTILNHGSIDPEMQLHVKTCTCEEPGFCHGVRSVFMRPGVGAGSWMERRVYVERCFVRADVLGDAGMRAAVVDLEEIVRNNGRSANRHTDSATEILQAFRLVLRVAGSGSGISSDVENAEITALVSRMRLYRVSAAGGHL